MSSGIAAEPATPRPADGDVFPLPLTPFELYYWFDNRSDYPTVFPIDLSFRGTPDRPAFEAAIQTVLTQHPLLNARLIVGNDNAPQWIDAQSAACPRWDVQEVLRVDPRIDLSQSSQPKICIQTDADRTRIRLLFHHACCDGAGAVQFIEDLLIAYHRRITQDDSVGLRTYDARRLIMRGDYGLTESGYRRNLRDDMRVAQSCLGLVIEQPQRLAGRLSNPPRAEAEFYYLSQPLTRDQVQGLRAVAKASGATLNDLLLRDMFLCLRDWNASVESTRRTGRGPFRITVPTDLRTRADQTMPAANVLSFAFLSRRARHLNDPRQLLDTIRDQMNAVKEHRLGLYFVGGLTFMNQLGLLKWMLRGERSFATAVLSNMGRVFARCRLPRDGNHLVAGDLVLERFEGVPPLRPGTRAAVALANYARETTIFVRCDPAYFAKDDTQEFLRCYYERLSRTARG